MHVLKIFVNWSNFVQQTNFEFSFLKNTKIDQFWVSVVAIAYLIKSTQSFLLRPGVSKISLILSKNECCIL